MNCYKAKAKQTQFDSELLINSHKSVAEEILN